MRYAICFTPPANDPLAEAAAQWLGRNVFSGKAEEHPGLKGLGVHEIALQPFRAGSVFMRRSRRRST